MATTLQLRRYTTAGLSGLTGADGEIFIDTSKKTVVVQDGATAGGIPLATETFVTSALAGFSTTYSSLLAGYATNANLTATLVSYTLNANLTSTLASYTTNTNLTATLVSYTLNANLTSTLNSYASKTFVTSALTSYASIAYVTSSIAAISSVGGSISTDAYTSVTATSGILTLNFSYGYSRVILDQSIVNINFVNLPTTGVAASIILEIEQNATGGYSISGSSFLTAGGVGLIVSTAASAISIVSFTSRNGGSRVFGTSAGRDWI